MEKALSVSDLFISLVIIPIISGTIFLNRSVGIGSVSQDLVFIALIILITSSSVTGVGLSRGVILSSDGSYLGCPSKLDLIFSIFSMKRSANIFAKSSSHWLGGNAFSWPPTVLGMLEDILCCCIIVKDLVRTFYLN